MTQLPTRRSVLAAAAGIAVLPAARRLSFAAPASLPATSPAATTFSPREAPDAVLHNPDMGWVHYENYPLDPRPGGSSTLMTMPDETFPGVDGVAIMFSWADVEKPDGSYDFTHADHAYDFWAKRGKHIQLRMSTESLLFWSKFDPPGGLGVPPHVLAKIPADRKQRRTSEGFQYDLVDARDPIYLAALEKFLAATNAHFGKDRPVTLVDLRGFGLWGEWHTGYRYASIDDRHAALSGVIDRYSAAFPDRFLALSYSYDPDSPKPLWDGPTNRFDPAFTKTYDDYVRYSAFDHALTKANVTLRRDGAGGAVHSNERKLNDHAFASRPRGPMMSEFVDGYAQSKRGDRGWVERKIEDALSLHPNYVNVLGWQGGDALAFLKERPDLIDKGLRTMGYRLVPTSVTLPKTITAGRAFRVDATWENRAVGRTARDYVLRLSLTDGHGKVAATADAGKMPSRTWVKGKSYEVSHAVTLRPEAAGEYELRLTVVDPATGKAIGLPLADGREDGSYLVGCISCEMPAVHR